MLEEHQEEELKRRAKFLEMAGYTFHVTSQSWAVRFKGEEIRRNLFEDDGGSSSAAHHRQGYENLLEAVEFADSHLDWRRQRYQEKKMRGT